MRDTALVPISESKLIGIFKKQAEYEELKAENEKLERKFQSHYDVLERANALLREALDLNMLRLVDLELELGRNKAPASNQRLVECMQGLQEGVEAKTLYRQTLLLIHRGGFWADNDLKMRLCQAYQQNDELELLRCYLEANRRFSKAGPQLLLRQQTGSVLEREYFNLSLYCQYYRLKNEQLMKQTAQIGGSQVYLAYIADQEAFSAFCAAKNAELLARIRQAEEDLALLKAQRRHQQPKLHSEQEGGGHV